MGHLKISLAGLRRPAPNFLRAAKCQGDHLQRIATALVQLVVCLILVLVKHAMAADLQVNQPDHNRGDLANYTTQSETAAAAVGSVVVVAWNDTNQVAGGVGTSKS